jgi:RNA-directed DNA polymerase
LGYTFTVHKQPKLQVAKESVKRFKRRLCQEFRKGRGRSVRAVLKGLRPRLIGWLNYFGKSEVKKTFEDLDRWIRRKLRCILWRQWKRRYRRALELMKRGLDRVRAWKSVSNGRGPWWNAGESHMNQAVPNHWLAQQGLVSLLERMKVKWCST